MTRPFPFRRYLLAIAGLTVAWLGAVAAFNYAVDPYLVWSTDSGTFTTAKPRASRQAGLARSIQVERVKPATLLLGNSRVEVGLDPQSPLWPAAFAPIYNLTQPGYGVDAPVLLLRHAATGRVPERVFLAVDFIDFLTSRDTDDRATTALEGRTRIGLDGKPNPGFTANRLKDEAKSLLSLTAFRDSIVTFWARSDSNADTMTPQGFNPLRSAIDATRIEGYAEFFRRKNVTYAERYGKPLRLISRTERSYALLDALIADCAQQGIEVTLFIHPYHADFLEILRHAGQWPAMEAWKTELTRTVAEAARGGMRIRLWDFSGYHARAMEPVPPASDKKAVVRWYWESGHYKRELGELLIARMLGSPEADPDFGVLLTPDTLPAVLTTMREQREAYARVSPEAVERIRLLFEKTTRPRRPSTAATG